jgi:F0F1-type ATP synthase delta subunit
MSISEVAYKYSRALASVIVRKQLNQKGLVEIENLIRFIGNKQVKERLQYPFWSTQKKCAIFNQLNLSPYLHNFINELIGNKRSDLLEDILEETSLKLRPVKKSIVITSIRVNKVII